MERGEVKRFQFFGRHRRHHPTPPPRAAQEVTQSRGVRGHPEQGVIQREERRRRNLKKGATTAPVCDLLKSPEIPSPGIAYGLHLTSFESSCRLYRCGRTNRFCCGCDSESGGGGGMLVNRLRVGKEGWRLL